MILHCTITIDCQPTYQFRCLLQVFKMFKIIIYIFLISISIHAFVCAQQDCQTVLTQCQKYNTIALDAYKKCHGKFDKLNEKFDKVKVNLNHSKIEVHHCKEDSSRCTILVVVPWVLLGIFHLH